MVSGALDIVALDRRDRRAPGRLPANPAAYFSYDAPGRAPCAGTVLVARDGHPDMPVPRRAAPRRADAHPSGNYLILRGAHANIVLAHLRRAVTIPALQDGKTRPLTWCPARLLVLGSSLVFSSGRYATGARRPRRKGS